MFYPKKCRGIIAIISHRLGKSVNDLTPQLYLILVYGKLDTTKVNKRCNATNSYISKTIETYTTKERREQILQELLVCAFWCDCNNKLMCYLQAQHPC